MSISIVLSMTRLLLVLAALLALLTPLAPSLAQTPPEQEEAGELTAAARPTTITHGAPVSISAELKKSVHKRNVPVLLQVKEAPFKGRFSTLETVTTGRKGTCKFKNLKPRVTTRYRLLAPLANAASKTMTVEVRPKVTLRLADDTPRAGELVEFSGTVAPDHDQQLVYIQRRLKNQRWRTVGRTALVDAGVEISEFSRKIRVERDGIYRARVIHPSDHIPGSSRPKAVNVVDA